MYFNLWLHVTSYAAMNYSDCNFQPIAEFQREEQYAYGTMVGTRICATLEATKLYLKHIP
jgi:hypothetical protein